MEKVRIGILGTGVIIRDYHIPSLMGNPQVELVAAGNLHVDSLRALADEYRIPKTYTDIEAMAADPDIDAVIVGLPNFLHSTATITLLKAGKHVLCEKPMAMSLQEGKQMVEAAQQARRCLMIAHMWRFDREIQWLRDVVRSGVLGDVFKVKSHAIWLHDGPSPRGWFVNPTYAGGGALADMGVHAIDILRYVLDGARPLRVFATTGSPLRHLDVDDTANLLLEFEGGVTGFVEAGWYHPYADGLEGYSQVYGSKGYARALPSELHTYVEGAWSVAKPMMPAREQQCDMPMYHRQIEHFVNCVLHNQEPLVGGCEALRTLRVLEAAYRSAETGQAVSISED